MKDRNQIGWVELIRVSFKNTHGKVGDANMDNGPQMIIVGDMNSLQLNENERIHGFQCPAAWQQIVVWIFSIATLLNTSVLMFPALV